MDSAWLPWRMTLYSRASGAIPKLSRCIFACAGSLDVTSSAGGSAALVGEGTTVGISWGVGVGCGVAVGSGVGVGVGSGKGVGADSTTAGEGVGCGVTGATETGVGSSMGTSGLAVLNGYGWSIGCSRERRFTWDGLHVGVDGRLGWQWCAPERQCKKQRKNQPCPQCGTMDMKGLAGSSRHYHVQSPYLYPLLRRNVSSRTTSPIRNLLCSASNELAGKG